MLTHATTLCATSSGLPSLFYHPLFRVQESALRFLSPHLVYAKDPVFGSNMAMVAAAKNRVPHLRWLLENGVSINDKDLLGLTALHYAALAGSEEAVRFLVTQGANTTSRDNRGKTPKDYAASTGFKGIIALL